VTQAPLADTTLVLRTGARSDVGSRRAVNEDSMLVADPVYAVADGMGGHAAGDLASQAAIAQLRSIAGVDGATVLSLQTALDDAQRSVRVIADANARGAGTTVTGVVSALHNGEPHWILFNVGDSRVYRQRDGVLEQLSHDHSFAQQLVDAGSLAKEDVNSYRGRNVITRAVGSDDSPADISLYPVRVGERVLICSDGLTTEVTDAVIGRLLSAHPDAQQAADELVARAILNGGRDNVTAVVIDVVSGAPADAPAGPVETDPPADSAADDDLDEDTIETVGRAPAVPHS
jgi:serine/threonine protein phosphatase PrpC